MEWLEMSHFIPARLATKGTWQRGLLNRPWNLRPQWGNMHALEDPKRFNFLNTANKEILEPYRTSMVDLPFGLGQVDPVWMRMPDWMSATSVGVSQGFLAVPRLSFEF